MQANSCILIIFFFLRTEQFWDRTHLLGRHYSLSHEHKQAAHQSWAWQRLLQLHYMIRFPNFFFSVFSTNTLKCMHSFWSPRAPGFASESCNWAVSTQQKFQISTGELRPSSLLPLWTFQASEVLKVLNYTAQRQTLWPEWRLLTKTGPIWA